jgi:hypothetical protein
MRADRNTGTVGSLAVTATVTAGELRIGGAGRVGVGVADPQARLDVDGTIRAQALQLIPRAEPAGPSAGLLYFDAERAALRVFDGERWIDLGAAGDADPGAGGVRARVGEGRARIGSEARYGILRSIASSLSESGGASAAESTTESPGEETTASPRK